MASYTHSEMNPSLPFSVFLSHKQTYKFRHTKRKVSRKGKDKNSSHLIHLPSVLFYHSAKLGKMFTLVFISLFQSLSSYSCWVGDKVGVQKGSPLFPTAWFPFSVTPWLLSAHRSHQEMLFCGYMGERCTLWKASHRRKVVGQPLLLLPSCHQVAKAKVFCQIAQKLIKEKKTDGFI